MRFQNNLKIVYMIILFFTFALNISSFAQENDISMLISQAKGFKKANNIKLNFDKIDIKSLSYFMGELRDKNIVIDPSINGEVTLISARKISLEDAWNLYLSVLKANNLTVMEKGNFVEIQREGNRKTMAPLTTDLSKSDKMVTYAMQIDNGDINNITNLFNGLKSSNGMVLNYRPSDTIIITDYAYNIENMKNILGIITSKESDEEIKIISLKYANSEDILNALSKIYSDSAQKGITFIIHNIKSLNSILIKTQAKVWKEMEKIITTLDVPQSVSSTRTFWVYYLKNAKAEDTATSLNKLLENIPAIPEKINEAENKAEVKPPENLKSEVAKADPLKTENRTDNTRQQSSSNSTATSDKPKLIAEKTSNALIVYATKNEYEAVKSLIESIDIKRKQVLITSIITEVSEKALKEMGVRWQLFGSNGGASFKGGLTNDNVYSLFGSSSFLGGFLSESGKSISVGGTSMFFPDLIFLFSLLDSGTGFNVISSPKLLTLDNQNAQITVSQVIPYASSVKYDVNGNPLIGYDYKEVGIKLKVTPHITDKDIIMELHQEANDVVGYEKPTVGEVSYVVPITSKREMDTVITIENGKTVVLGGLVSKKTIKTMESVPFFSSIPVVGNLFKYNSDELNKTYLFVFMTPHIINTTEELSKITEEHQKMSEELNKSENGKKQKRQ